jgi:hypothetical protein
VPGLLERGSIFVCDTHGSLPNRFSCGQQRFLPSDGESGRNRITSCLPTTHLECALCSRSWHKRRLGLGEVREHKAFRLLGIALSRIAGQDPPVAQVRLRPKAHRIPKRSHAYRFPELGQRVALLRLLGKRGAAERQKGSPPHEGFYFGAEHEKFAPSSMLPVPLYVATCG